MNLELKENKDYKNWLCQIKNKFRKTQLKATITVNSEMLLFYWNLGSDIVHKQKNAPRGNGLLQQLSNDLKTEFPDVKGFSLRNLKYIKQWYSFYNQENTIGQQAVAQLRNENNPEFLDLITRIPWGHNIAIITKCNNTEEAFYYANAVLQYNWSRDVLKHQIESGLYQREGKAITNFKAALPAPQSDLAQQTLKDPYLFDFLAMRKDYNERELEQQLIAHITQFLLELGAGFAYLGKQVPLQVGEREFFIDLLFYHTQLHCYIVIELKTTEFEPEHAGKLNFYIKAVDEKLRKKGDEPTIGIIICKSKDRLVAEYALSDINKPIGVSEYKLTQSLPDNLKPSLPSIEEIEAEFSEETNNE